MRTHLENFKHIMLYGIMLALLVFVLKLLQWKFLIIDNSVDIYVGMIAIFFTVLGVWLATQLTKPKIEKVIIEKEVIIFQSEEFSINELELNRLNLTNREYEILQLLAKGNSNAAIADLLFLSISTVKTHISNLYVKMDVKSRGQAIIQAKKLNIVA